MNILVADDDPIVLRSCRRVLEAEGHRATLVDSAREALAAMAEQRFNLVLVDVIMEEKNGIYLIEEIRKRWSDVPIVLMSGYSTPETISEGMKAGASQYIPKPFTPDELVAAIQNALTAE
jgi:DNA-binding NtrC family response regulator